MKLSLSSDELTEIRRLITELRSHSDTAEDPAFLRRAALAAHELPARLRSALTEFRLTEPAAGFCRIAGYRPDVDRIGGTPSHWKDRRTPSPTLEEEMLLVVCGFLLGEPIAWATQQCGYLVHDILPISGQEHEQLGTGSEEILCWHVEDAFHPFRGDYLGMLCLRNPDGVATTFASLDGIALDAADRDLLFQPLYTIRPDESHLVKNRGAEEPLDDDLRQSYRRVEVMNDGRERISVLFGDPADPYLRIDPYFMDPVEDPRAQQALDRLIAAIDARLQDVVLSAGELIFIDNFKAVHGRKPFKARYDGQDRWLKRINVARDLRKSRSARRGVEDRVIY